MNNSNIVQLIIKDMITNQNKMINYDDDREEQDMVADQLQSELDDLSSEHIDYSDLLKIRNTASECGYLLKNIDFELAKLQASNYKKTHKEKEIELAYKNYAF